MLQYAKMNVEMVAQWRLAASAKASGCDHTAAIWPASEVRLALVAAPRLTMICLSRPGVHMGYGPVNGDHFAASLSVWTIASISAKKLLFCLSCPFQLQRDEADAGRSVLAVSFAEFLGLFHILSGKMWEWVGHRHTA